MNKKTRHDLLFLLIIIVLAIGIGMIITPLASGVQSLPLYGSLQNGVNKEPFIPAINGFYRPYARRAHNYASKKWDHMSSGAHRFMKSFGLK
jgi:hypothetical protein